MANHNKNAATEDQVGYLHNAITRMFTKKADAILKVCDEDPEAAISLVEGKDLNAMAKWVLDNGITAIPSESVGTSELSKKLAKIKANSNGKVIDFVDRKEA